MRRNVAVVRRQTQSGYAQFTQTQIGGLFVLSSLLLRRLIFHMFFVAFD